MFALPCGPFGRWVGVFLQIASCNVTLYIFVFKKKKKKIQKVSHSLLPVTFSRVFLSFNMVIPLGLNFHTSFKISYFKQNLFWHLNNFCNRIFKQPFSRLACKSSSWMFFLGREKAKTKPEMRCDYGFNLFAVCKKCFVSNFRLLKQNVDLYGGGGGTELREFKSSSATQQLIERTLVAGAVDLGDNRTRRHSYPMS